jgi:hypothetical protein
MITLTREEAQQVLDCLAFSNLKEADAAAKTLRTRLAQPEPKNKALTHEENKAHNQKILDEFYKENAALYEPKPAKLLLIPALMEQAGWVRKREWQGLTDEEIMSLLPGAVRLPPGWSETVRAIEAKLKEKNT